jgi:hypothetical protein
VFIARSIAPAEAAITRGERRNRRGHAWRGQRWAWCLVLAALASGLYIAYLHLSQAQPENSDEANILLMASDMAHGNVLLHGWNVSDVPFITTELPQIALLTWMFGLRVETAHIAAAMTYSLVTLTAMALARGGTTGTAAITRMLLALAIMIAPQPGIGVFVLILSVGHIGTALPVLLTWLAVERYGSRPWAALLIALLLAWALTADPLVTVIAIVPLALVAAIRREWRLVAAAAAGYLIALAAGHLVSALGGYAQQPVPYAITAPATWWWHARVMVHGLLAMFGAYYVPGPQLNGLDEAIAASHVVGVVLATWAALATARRLFRRGRGADMISQLLLAGIAANLGAYVTSTLANASALNTREVAPVLPFAAVLAGRVLAGRVLAVRKVGGGAAATVIGLAGVTLGGYCYGLGVHAAAPAAADPYAQVEAYLESQHLTHGLSGYWQSSYITVDTGGAITLRAVVAGCLQPYQWESKPSWYAPSKAHPANFILSDTRPGYFQLFRPAGATLRTLKAWYPHAERVPFGGMRLVAGGITYDYVIHVYPADLMAQLPRVRAALQSVTAPCG